MTTFKDIDLLQVGHSIQLAGAVYSSPDKSYLCLFPDEAELPIEVLRMTQDEWVAFIRQTDLLETEVTAREADGTIGKAIVRKSMRQIEQGISWEVFRRDHMKCRYCGADDVPLTVDHLVLWEEGGPSTVPNLVSACRKCNKTRGNTSYEEWLQNPYYLKVSKNLSPAEVQANADLLPTLSKIPIRPHKRGR